MLVVCLGEGELPVDDGKLLAFLERVSSIADGEEDAAEHPQVCFVVHVILHVLVNHFRRPVHQGGVLLKCFVVVLDHPLLNRRIIWKSFPTQEIRVEFSRSKISQLEFLLM